VVRASGSAALRRGHFFINTHSVPFLFTFVNSCGRIYLLRKYILWR
jgi:hypothetical protein